MEKENEVVVPETTEEVTPEVTTTDEVVEETVEEVKARLEEERKAREKAEELANNYKVRAEKAEKKNKETVTPAPKVEKSSNISIADIAALNRENVHEDDIERVEKFAKTENLTIREALKNPELKAILNVRAEQRNVAVATNTGNARRSSARLNDEALLANANAGKLPESDDEIARLIKAKQGRK